MAFAEGFLVCLRTVVTPKALTQKEEQTCICTISALNTSCKFFSPVLQTNEIALIDSGATKNFLSFKTLEKLKLRKVPLNKMILVYNVDETKNKLESITHYAWLQIKTKLKMKLQQFFVTDLRSDDILLGYPFLKVFNSKINWAKGEVDEISLETPNNRTTFASLLQRRKEKARRSIAQDWACEAAKTKVKVKELPDEYKRHEFVFLEEGLKCFPPQREKDMSIKLAPDAPEVINCKVYPLSKNEQQLLKDFIDKETSLGCIKEGPSSYTSSVYFINKKDSEEKHIIMDYRTLNKWTICDNNPLPNIKEAFENFRGKGLFLKFEIRWGYNNVRIKRKDQYKAAFKTRYGTYLPQVMYFGLKNAPPFFQRLMYRDFRALLQKYPKNLGNYMDDWWVATSNDKEGQILHRQICHEFLDRMKEKLYFLKLSKTKFEEPVIEILGWQVTEDGVRIDLTKVVE